MTITKQVGSGIMFRNACARLVVSVIVLTVAASAYGLPLQNGGELTGSLTSPTQVIQYNFSGSAGDTVFLSVGDITIPASSFAPDLKIYDSSGNLVASDWGGVGAFVNFTLANANQYTALIQDHYSNYTGSYSISYARIPDASEGGTLSNTSSINGAIDFGDMDTFTLLASPGQTIHLNVGDLSGSSFAPHLYLFDPTGALVSNNWGGVGAPIRYQTVIGGRYTVLIKDHYNTYTGGYELHYARAPGASEHGILENDEMVSESITTGDIDSYRTVLNAGQVIHVNVGDKSATSFAPHVYLYDSSGALRADSWGGVGTTIRYEVLSSGPHTIVVVDHYGVYTADYDLYMARAPGANEGGALSNSDIIVDGIDPSDIDTFSMDCDANAFVQLGISDLSFSSFAPHLYLYDFSGDLIADSWGGTTVQISSTVPVSGEYTVILQDHYGVYAGNYELDVSLTGCGSGPPMCDGMTVTVDIGTGQLPTIGDDVILGTAGADTIYASGGNDIVCALGGNDTIYSGAGNDRIFGGAGKDTIYAGTGSDYVDGGPDADTVYGAGGPDTILGGGGFDRIFGGSGNDDIETGDGGAIVFAGGNNDVIEGSPDRDVINGNSGLDTIYGRGGDDELYGGNGSDYIFGGKGADIINGQGANDYLYGQEGDDLIRGGVGNDLLDGGSNTDECDGQGGTDTEIRCEI